MGRYQIVAGPQAFEADWPGPPANFQHDHLRNSTNKRRQVLDRRAFQSARHPIQRLIGKIFLGNAPFPGKKFHQLAPHLLILHPGLLSVLVEAPKQVLKS
jgi:hypothetical protein